MIKIIPVITWDGKDAVSLGRTLKSVLEFNEVHLWTTTRYADAHRVISTVVPGGSKTDIQVFEVTSRGSGHGRMKNQAIIEVAKSGPEAYLTFLEAGDIVRVDPDPDCMRPEDPIYLGDTLGEYVADIKLYEVLEDSYPTSTAGLLLNAQWLLEEGITFDDLDTEFGFLRKVFYEFPGRLWTTDFTVEVSGARGSLGDMVRYVKSLDLDPESDTDYYACRHTLTRLILDAIVNEEQGSSEYIECAYSEKRI